MMGRDENKTFWMVLKIDRLDPAELNILEDPTIYTEYEYMELMERIHEGNRSTGGLKFVTECFGIIGMYVGQICTLLFGKEVNLIFVSFICSGFIKFLGPHYMLIITKRRKIGTICGHAIYSVAKTEMIPIPNSPVLSNSNFSKNENRSFVHSACKCNMPLGQFRDLRDKVL